MPALATEFAAHVERRRTEELSAEALREAKTLIRDYLGLALRGGCMEAARIVAEYQSQVGPREATILADGRTAGAPGAAFANAVAAHSLELDDTDQASMVHLSAPVVSAALAQAEALGSSGEQFVRAVVTGCEIMQAVSDAANPGMRDRGFHSTAVCGVFGATAAASSLLGLSVEQVVSALGLAGAHASGTFEIYGPTMQKSIQVGPPAHNGIVAARLARLGITGAPTIFDGRAGILTAFSADAHIEYARERLRRGAPLGIEYKPYACFRPIHTAIDCARAIRQELTNGTEEIVDLVLYRHPAWAGYHRNPAPENEQAAKASINHAVAVALVSGEALLEQFAPSWIADSRVRRLSMLLRIEVDDGLPRGDSCRLRAVTADGRVLEHRADYPRGSMQVPMSEDEHRAKFRYLTQHILTDGQAATLLDRVERVDSLESVGELVTACAGGPEPSDR